MFCLLVITCTDFYCRPIVTCFLDTIESTACMGDRGRIRTAKAQESEAKTVSSFSMNVIMC
jgi:hypothetical protein